MEIGRSRRRKGEIGRTKMVKGRDRKNKEW